MSDIIHLLPDNIANQIAAGEVIQRPASAVKELLENAVDAGADEVRLLVKEAGKTLIQVSDNGKGMSEMDARMAFERHATSKIKEIDDLFQIRTMGFRGEALASIAAVAQVELKTKRKEDEAGTLIEIENSRILNQEPVAAPTGTSIAMKNLFFNVPARRNFLKSNASEMKHIIDEFIRVTMAHPEVFFSFTSNGQEVFHLEKGNLKQRIVQLLGNSYAAKLVSVQENTDYLDIFGFVGKPDLAKKTRGDQFFFVNGRFIKSPYLHHAVMQAFEALIPTDSFPMYALFIDIDPARLDINVHPTKQEIKFEDEKIVYAFVQSAVKHALAQFSVTPTLDFELDPGIQQSDAINQPLSDKDFQQAASGSLFKSFSQKNQAHFIDRSSDLKHWKDLYETGGSNPVSSGQDSFSGKLAMSAAQERFDADQLVQVNLKYIIVPLPDGFLLVHQQNAHEAVLYDQFSKTSLETPIPSQRLLFPTTIELNAADVPLFSEIILELSLLGYHIEHFGKNTFAIQGIPSDIPEGSEKAILENMLEQYKLLGNEQKISSKEKAWRSLAAQQAIKPGTRLNLREMQTLIHGLFDANLPGYTPQGRSVYRAFNNTDLEKQFGR